MTEAPYKIRISPVVDIDQRDSALKYIEAKMRETFHCDPPTTKGLILGAYTDNQIVGSIVMESSKVDIPFGIESRYDFDGENYLSTRRYMIVEGSRWLASLPGASLLLLQTAAYIAVNLGKNYMLIEAKEYSVKRLRELGATVTAVANSQISLSRTRAVVGENGMKYFSETPAPSLFLIDLTTLLLRSH